MSDIMSDFYIHLQSDASFSQFPENTISNFKNFLSVPVSINPEDFEVALVECSYTYSECFINKGELLFEAITTNHKKIKATATDDIRSLSDFIYQLNNWPKLLMCKIEKEKLRYTIYAKNVSFSNKVTVKLGLEESDYIGNSISPEYRGKNRVFLPSGQTKLFVYSDIIKPQRVGDSFAPLLRMVPFKGEDLKTTVHELQHLQYLSIAKADFEYIHVYIKTETGEAPPYEAGTFSVTLHFQRKTY